MITLSTQAGPIYEQVKAGLRRMVVTGALTPGDPLPSVRAMASALAVNPNTIQRAYEALEQEGYLCTVAGKGSFACPGNEVTALRREALLRSFDETASELIWLGLTPEELTRRLAPCAGEAPEKSRRERSV